MKKLYRSKDNKVIAGVMGGIGDCLSVDPTILRLVYAFFVIFTALVPGVLLYIVAMIVMPLPGDHDRKEVKNEAE